MAPKRLLVTVAGAAALLVAVPAASVAAGGATVIIERGGSSCWIDHGDIPGLPDFQMASSTVTITPDGRLNVTCTGPLPAGLSVAATFAGNVTCHGDTADVVGHIVATPAGRVVISCHFAAP